MAESLDHARLAMQNAPRHSAMVRITHWVNSFSFLALVISGIAILIAHPRFYWGETGALGTPSLFDLPIPFLLGHSGWGRYLHFLAAWVCVLNGVLYVVAGWARGHFQHDLMRPGGVSRETYSLPQRAAYLAVIFALFPLMIVTGLAMSPAITSVAPVLVEVFGGQQSARTVHFIVADLLVVFLAGHILMVSLAGFVAPVRCMITGQATAMRKEAL